MSTADEIKKLNDLLRDRVITQEEFDSQKEKLLDSSTKTNSGMIVEFLDHVFIGVFLVWSLSLSTFFNKLG